MADARTITLRAGLSPATNVQVGTLSVDPASGGTVIYLSAGHATPSNIVLRDPTNPPSATISGALAVTESSDVASISGNGSAFGGLAATEASDAASISGNVPTGVSGSLASTEAVDVAVFAGAVLSSGALSVTEAADVAAFSGSIIVSGSLAATEGADIASLVASLSVFGSLAATEVPDAALFAGDNGSGSASAHDWITLARRRGRR
jgi:hypothetical protein